MGRARRCRSVVISASVAALGATSACPVANAANSGTPGPTTTGSGGRAVVAHKRVAPRSSTPHTGPFVYTVHVNGEISSGSADMRCVGSAVSLTRITFVWPETPATEALAWGREEATFLGQLHNITGTPATTVTMTWMSPQETSDAERNGGELPYYAPNKRVTAAAATVCAATTPNAGIASIGEGTITWRLPKRVSTVAQLLAQPAANVAFQEVMVAFQIQPNGSVPNFQAS